MHDISQKQIFFKKLPKLDPDPDLMVKFPDPTGSGSATLLKIYINSPLTYGSFHRVSLLVDSTDLQPHSVLTQLTGIIPRRPSVRMIKQASEEQNWPTKPSLMPYKGEDLDKIAMKHLNI
jgi:hypothetical protein